MNQIFFSNENDRLFTVVLKWSLRQPFVVGTLPEVVQYALDKGERGIEAFYEITYGSYCPKLSKVSKVNLKSMLSHKDAELGVQLFSKY
jgi:hypothetical protein